MLKIVLLSIFVGLSIVHGFSILFSVNHVAEVIGSYIGSLLSALLQGVAWVTGIFALLEYNDVTLQRDAKGKTWNPAQLPPIPNEKAKISRVESVFSILFITIILTLFFFSPEAIGIYYFIGETMEFIPLFNHQELIIFRSLIFIAFTLEIFVEVIKIIKGRWTSKAALFVTGLNVLSTGLVIYGLSNSSIWNPEIISRIERILPISFEQILSLVIMGIVLVTIIESVSALYRGFKYGVEEQKLKLNFK